MATARWIGPADRPSLAWLDLPADDVGTCGVLIAPPVGYLAAVAHRALRALAEQLSTMGHRVLRVDYDGTGDSAGDQGDPDRLGAWSLSLRRGAGELRRLGSAEITVVGLQLGATLALQMSEPLGADRIVAWDPVINGRQLAREIRVLGVEVPRLASSDDATNDHHGGSQSDDEPDMMHAGTLYSAATLADLRGLRLTNLDRTSARGVLVVDRDGDMTSESLVDRLRDLGATVEREVVDGVGDAFDQPTEYATVPLAALDTICRWIGPATTDGPEGARRTPARQQAAAPEPVAAPATATIVDDEAVATMTVDGAKITETVIRLGPDGLVGILTAPSGKPRATVVWLNAGSESHVGPGRAWVEYARALATRGYASVRLDFSGWGESPDLGHAPGRPYDQHGISDAIAAALALRKLGHSTVVLAGLCAGAWIALRAALTGPISGVVAINPQMYWQPGDPVEADILMETRVRREDEIERFAWGAEIGLWSALDRLGFRHPAAVWLDELVDTKIPILQLFTEADDGLQFLHDRVGDSWAEALASDTIEHTVLDRLDHPMHRRWLRYLVVDAISDFLDRRFAAPAASEPPQARD
jgi:alpha-beta hydrolase superfamily lysophospholipase